MRLPPNAYNAGLLRFRGRLLLSYRWHSRGDWRTELGIAELSGALSLNSCKPVFPPKDLQDNSIEDARLFLYQGNLWISCTISQWPVAEHKSIVIFGKLLEAETHWRLDNFFVPAFGRNDFSAIEKNFIPWAYGEKLYCLYMTNSEEQIWLELDGARVEEVHKSKALRWPYAPIHGGAICEGRDGNLLHFFNSHLSHGDRSLDRYLVGVAELSGHPPFEMLRISQQPILAGEEGCNLTRCKHYKNGVVFVCGAIKEKDGYLVSFGHNDSSCRIARLRPEDLKL